MSFDIDYLRNVVSVYPTLRTLILLDSRGIIVGDTRLRQPGKGVDVSDRDYFTSHIKLPNYDVHISDPVASRVDGKWTWVLSAAIRSSLDGLIGVAAVSIDRGFFRDVTAAGGHSDYETILLVHKTGFRV